MMFDSAYILEAVPVDTDGGCLVIPVHDIDNNQEHDMAKTKRHNKFIKAAYARIKDIGDRKSKSTVTNTGGYIQVSRGKNV